MNWMGKAIVVAPLIAVLGLTASSPRAQSVPVFEMDHPQSSIKFNVNASVSKAGTFDKWDASLAFTAPGLPTGVLDRCKSTASHLGGVA